MLAGRRGFFCIGLMEVVLFCTTAPAVAAVVRAPTSDAGEGEGRDMDAAEANRLNSEARKDARDRQQELIEQGDRAQKAKEYERAADYYKSAVEVTYRHYRRGESGYVSEQRTLGGDYARLAERRLAGVRRILEAPLRAFQQAERLAKAGQLAEAYEQFQRLAEADTPAEFRRDYQPKCRQYLTEIETAAEGVLKQASDAMATGNVDEVRKHLAAFQRAFGDFKASERINASYAALMKDPQLRELIRNEEATRLLEIAKKNIERRAYAHAFAALERLEKDYADTAPGQEGIAKLKELRADEVIMRLLAEEKAEAAVRAVLQKARGYAANEMYEEAIAAYEQIIAEHPDTPAAAAAQKAIEEIRSRRGDEGVEAPVTGAPGGETGEEPAAGAEAGSGSGAVAAVAGSPLSEEKKTAE